MTTHGNGIFAQHYKGLNDAQKQAVDTIEGPVMVVAGPGTGKTHILALRIANILLKTDTQPQSVLALTFTEAGVEAMKKRLLKLIGPTAYKVPVYTFHSFCNDLIHTYPEYFPRIISSVALTDIESILFIREAIDTLELDKLKPFGDPYFYVQAIRSAISTLKRENKIPGDVIENTRSQLSDIATDPESRHIKGAHKGKIKGDVQKRIDKLHKEHELGAVFEYYEQLLTERKKFDFEDMIGEVVRALEEHETFRLTVQEQYLYILADEHQDANGSQNKLLELLASFHTSPNLFIVGDEKQSIFRFQGATLDSFDRFKATFPDAVLIPLTDSYRSGTTLLDAAHSLMQESVPPERHPRLVSRSSQPELARIEARTFSSEDLECTWVARDIALRIGEGVHPNDIAIIFRTNSDARDISRALSLAGVLHTLESKSNILKDHIIAQLVTYLRLCTHIGNDEYISYVLHFPWISISAHDTYRIILYAERHRLSRIEVLADKQHLKEAGVQDSDACISLARTLNHLATISQEQSARDFFDTLLHQSGFLTYVLSRPDAVSVLNSVRGLARVVEGLSATRLLYTGRDFVEDLALYEQYGIDIEPDVEPRERTQAVHLVTAHRSKGLEYEYVYIIHARDGHWGNRLMRDKLPLSTLSSAVENDIEDERRLLYVALTRARQYVSISYGIHSAHREKEAIPMQFFAEIDPQYIHTESTEQFEARILPHEAFTLLPDPTASMSDKDFLRDAFLEQGLSATALNNYLDCPWKYFYRSLVRIPEKPTPSSLYGNALHYALRLFRDLSNSTRTYQPLSVLLDLLDTAIKREGFTPTSFADAQKKGVRALTQWYADNEHDYQFSALSEKKFDVYMPLSQIDLPTILLRGMIDVIEFRDDGSVHVIDYKTGKHKSRNELEGNTKNATGDYKRQLDFYCILLELSQMQQPHELRLDFIEPDEKGKTTSHTFGYDPGSVQTLRETIARVASEIYSLSFWDTTCNEKECAYCKLRFDSLKI